MNKILHITFLLFLCNSLFAQEAKKARADKDHDKFAYIRASELYERLLENGYESKDLYSKLGDTYYFNARYAEALPYYRKMMSYEGETEPEYYYRYAQCLKADKEYGEADKVLDKFYNLVGHPKEDNAKLLQFVENLENGSPRYVLTDAGINTAYADFGTGFYGKDQVVFASARDTGIFVKRTHKWNQMPFLKLYTSTIDSTGILTAPEKLKGEVNSKYHQTTAVVTKDKRTMYFTRNNYRKGKFRKSEDGTNHLKIYRATYTDGEWGNIEDLSINDDAYSTAHPALSPDDKHLYFVSDRPGTLGNTDIFVTEILDNGNLGPVQNLRADINTPGKETFPFMDENGRLYFASNGHNGLGGLDIFTAIRDPFGRYRIVNLGSPVNSVMDDFAFIMRGDGRGFLSSNRGQETGFDNIYALSEKEPLNPKATLCGLVRDSITKEPLSDAKVTLYDRDNEMLNEVLTDASGNFCIPVWPFTNYNLRGGKEEYQSREHWINELENDEKREVVIDLVRDGVQVTTGDDLTEKLGLKPIYFDFDGSGIRKVSEIELGKVIEVMKQYPGLVIEVRSHTDSRGSDTYNMALSERRARATVNYILNKGGISSDRISSKGYGETELINPCTDGVSCTEEQHQQNRRSEFILMQM
ncbi:OmpA family protein [Sinomicrobium sp. M5D2P17]